MISATDIALAPQRRGSDGTQLPLRRTSDAAGGPFGNIKGALWDEYVRAASRVIGAVTIREGHVNALRGYLKQLGRAEGLVVGDRVKRMSLRRDIEDFLMPAMQGAALQAQDAIDGPRHVRLVGKAGAGYLPLERLPVAGQVINDLYTETRGLGVLDELFENDLVTDVHVYAWNHVRYLSLEKDALRGTHRIAKPFPTQESYEAIVRALLDEGGVTAKASEPVIKFTINNFLRVHYIGKEISQTKSPVLAIRKYRRQPLSIDKLIADHTLTPEAAQFLREIINARISVVLGGPPGSGKTTLLQALLWWMATGVLSIRQAPSPRDGKKAKLVLLPYRGVREARTIVIEDECELVLPEWAPGVQLESQRHGEDEKSPATMAGLTQNLLWEQPDLVVLGEVTDGPATNSALEAMTMGRPVITTSHGRMAADVLSRWQIWSQEARKQLDSRTVEQRIALAIGYVVIMGDGFEQTRSVTAPKSMVLSIEEVRRNEHGELTTVPAFVLNDANELVPVEGYVPRESFRALGVRSGVAIGDEVALRRQQRASRAEAAA